MKYEYEFEKKIGSFEHEKMNQFFFTIFGTNYGTSWKLDKVLFRISG